MKSFFRIAIVAAALGALGGFGFFRHKVNSGVTASARGARVALKLGCFSCHGMGGQGGVANPGSDGNVEGWNPHAMEELVKTPVELDEWVLDGGPQRLKAAPPSPDEHPLLSMPAYRGKIGDQDFADLKIYLRAVSGLDAPPPAEAAALAGYQLARDKACFGCHGPSGRGLLANPRSLAGYTPAWEGPVFDDLVKNDDELQDWIHSGGIERLQKNKLAAHFMERQIIAMPAYEGVLTDEEINKVVAYIHWLRKQPRD